MGQKIMVGMSGGVDSSVAACLLLRQGYDVTGVTFKLWDDPAGDSGCCSADDVRDAAFVCEQLGIPHYVINYKELFREKVVAPFAEEYLHGRTPNPCINCNRYIKFGAFSHKLKELGFDLMAADSLKNNRFHQQIDANYYASFFNEGAAVNELDFVVLSALEIDTDFNVNVLTGSDGVIRGAIGGSARAVGNRLELGVRLPALLVPALADDAAIAHEHAAHQRVRVRPAPTAPGQLDGAAHEAGIVGAERRRYCPLRFGVRVRLASLFGYACHRVPFLLRPPCGVQA